MQLYIVTWDENVNNADAMVGGDGARSHLFCLLMSLSPKRGQSPLVRT